jgi:GT2 family glycosyltransferase
MAVANSFISNRIADQQAEGPVHAHGIEVGLTRPEVRGKFIFIDDRKYWIKGVTYGTFAPDDDGLQFPSPEVVESDLAAMAANGLNTLRTYTVPPRWLLDAALRHDLRVMVGLPWEQHVAFLDDTAITARIEISVRDAVRQCAGHPAVLCYALGNEIPASIVRWHGRRAIEDFLKRLYHICKVQDPDALFTYVNFPTTEYLQLPFLDLICFNVYLETREKLSGYLARLQNIAGEKPLLMAEIGLDSRRNGEDTQAESLAWQVQTALTSGCIGAFAFAWTDEWYRGGHDIDDWDFGLTSRDRSPKPALDAVRAAFAAAPFPPDTDWPKVSVVVCSYNGSATIRDTMEGFVTLEYPNFEVIVVNDGSTDAVPDIVSEYLGRFDLRLISTANRGLSNARNTGWQEASGEIIAYIDDDAYPDPHWLQYLAHTFMTTDYVGVGGPNIAPPGDGPIADCVANSPGGPVQVLISDIEAEHIPGCNMAFRREALAAIDGFDARYRAAGDDVDLCWRLQEAGGKIGFNAAAMDWHHRRNSVMMYWKQQQGYGKAEALLEEKWPEKYNALGHFSWSGRLYGKGMTEAIPTRRNHVYQGQWGLALFQSIYEPAAGFLTSLPLMPEWFLLIGMLAIVSLLGLSWSPLLWATPLLIIAIAAPIAQAILSAAKADFPSPHPSAPKRFGLRALTALLHLIQPVARLKGRLEHGLTLWRQRTSASPNWNILQSQTLWSEEWRAPDAWLGEITALARQQHKVVREGGDFDDWDIELSGGLGDARLIMAIEEHGAGKEMLRFRFWCRLPTIMIVTLIAGSVLAALAALQDAWVAAAIISLGMLATAWFSLRQATQGMAVIADVLKQYREEQIRAQSDPDTSAGDEYPEAAATK